MHGKATGILRRIPGEVIPVSSEGDVLGDPDHFLGRFVESPQDPLVQKSEKGIGVEFPLIARRRVRVVLRVQHRLKGVVHCRLPFPQVDQRQQVPIAVIEKKEIRCICQGKVVTDLKLMLFSPALPQPDQLEGDQLVLCLV